MLWGNQACAARREAPTSQPRSPVCLEPALHWRSPWATAGSLCATGFSMWHLSSPTRDQTHIPASEDGLLTPDHQGSPRVHCFPQWLYQITVPQTMHKISLFSTFLPAVISPRFDDSHSNKELNMAKQPTLSF